MNTLTHTDFQSIATFKRELVGSKSLASMLPMLLTTGVITFAISAVTRLLWLGFSNDFFGAWMEAWLTTWPIAFPLAYMGWPLAKRLTTFHASPAMGEPRAVKSSGLSIWHIDDVAFNASEKNQLQIRRSAQIHNY